MIKSKSEPISKFFIGSLVNSGLHLGRTVRKTVRTFSYSIYFLRKKHVIINMLHTLFSLKLVVNLLESVASSFSKFMIIDSLYFAYNVYEFPEMVSGALLYRARWIGGLLSNFKEVWNSLYLDTLRDSKFRHFINMITVVTKSMYRLPNVVFVPNRHYGLYPMKEASSLMIPVISLLNSNTTSDWAMYWLPANDRSPYSLKFFFELFDYVICILKLRRLSILHNKLAWMRVKELLWLNRSIEGSLLPIRNVDLTSLNTLSITGFLSNELDISKGIAQKNIVQKLVFKSDKKRNIIKSSQSVLKARNRVLKRGKVIRRFVEWRKRRVKNARIIKIKKYRRFLLRGRNKRFKYNVYVRRKKIFGRFLARKVVKLLKAPKTLFQSRRVIRRANTVLFRRYVRKMVIPYMLFDNVLFKLNQRELKRYVGISNIFLKMSEQAKLAYVDKLNISQDEKLKLLNS